MIGRSIVALAVLALCASTAHPQAIGTISAEPSCPPERPVRKMVETGFGACTLKACVGKMICDPGPKGKCYYGQAPLDCNTCTVAVEMRCFTQREIDEATK